MLCREVVDSTVGRIAHTKLRADRPLTEADIIAYLAHSRVTEQRAAEQMGSLRRHSVGNADVSLARGIDAIYLYERLGGWRRMVTLHMPSNRDPLGQPAASRAHHDA